MSPPDWPLPTIQAWIDLREAAFTLGNPTIFPFSGDPTASPNSLVSAPPPGILPAEVAEPLALTLYAAATRLAKTADGHANVAHRHADETASTVESPELTIARWLLSRVAKDDRRAA